MTKDEISNQILDWRDDEIENSHSIADINLIIAANAKIIVYSEILNLLSQLEDCNNDEG